MLSDCDSESSALELSEHVDAKSAVLIAGAFKIYTIRPNDAGLSVRQTLRPWFERKPIHNNPLDFGRSV